MDKNRLFKTDLLYENSRQETYNSFYEKNGLKVYSRCDWNTEKGKAEQLKDMDVILQAGNIRLSVSEKERSKDYGDIFVELYHVFEDGRRKNGWLYETKAELLSYFTPTKHYFVNMSALKDTVIGDILPLIKDDISNFEGSGARVGTFYRKIGGKPRKMSATMARNEGNGAKWKTYGLCIPVSDLEDYGVTVDITEMV